MYPTSFSTEARAIAEYLSERKQKLARKSECVSIFNAIISAENFLKNQQEVVLKYSDSKVFRRINKFFEHYHFNASQPAITFRINHAKGAEQRVKNSIEYLNEIINDPKFIADPVSYIKEISNAINSSPDSPPLYKAYVINFLRITFNAQDHLCAYNGYGMYF